MDNFLDNIFNWISKNPLITIIIVLVLLLILIYNNLNAKKKRVEKAFSTIDVYLEKRFDQISALLEQTLTAYQFEGDVHTQIAGLRNGILAAKKGSINDKVKVENQITGFIASPGFRTEGYPELDAIVTLGMYTAEKTSEVEDNIAAARNQYNSNATSYNTAITSFPSVLVAGIFGFKTPFELFKVSEGKKERPTMRSIKENL